MAEDTATLTIKVGDKEVRFEAGLEAVKAELARHAAELLRGAGDGARAELSVTAPVPAAHPAGSAGAVSLPMPAKPPRGVTLDPRRVAALYAANSDGQLRLRVLPDTGKEREADTLMLLLYGLLVLKGQAPLTAPALLRAARQSGLRIQRAHRPLGRHTTRVSSSGYRRGKRYRLKAAGIEHCETLIPALLERIED